VHLSDMDIGVLLDRDGDPSARRLLDAHLITCPSCQSHLAEFEATERLIGDSLRATDPPVPRLTVWDTRAATSHLHPARRPTPKATRIAAAVALLITTAALAAAATRGPLAGLITRTRHATGPQPIQPRAPAPTQARGVGIVTDSAVEVDFRVAQDAGEIHLTVGSGPRLLIKASADGPRYVVRHDGVAVDNARTDRASYNIEIPRPPTTVTVRIGDQTAYRRVGTQVIVPMWVYRFAPQGNARGVH
jgi:hypothetical protein